MSTWPLGRTAIEGRKALFAGPMLGLTNPGSMEVGVLQFRPPFEEFETKTSGWLAT